jgi:large subunit ribosomal protein L35
MPKMKTRKSVSKRVKASGGGKLVRTRAFSGCHHILTKKSPKRKRKFRKAALVSAPDTKRIKKLVPGI